MEMTAKDIPIDLIVHTPGGLVLAAEQIAAALAVHPANVTVYVPHYAMSGGTLIALSANKIVMAPSAVLGPVDPQLGEYAAASILAAVARKDVNEVDDKTLIMADLAAKAQTQVKATVEKLVGRHLDKEKAAELAVAMTDGRWTHDFPIDAEMASSLGLPVSTELPDEIRHLMRLFPQPRYRRPSVEYIPMPYSRPDRERPARPRPGQQG